MEAATQLRKIKEKREQEHCELDRAEFIFLARVLRRRDDLERHRHSWSVRCRAHAGPPTVSILPAMQRPKPSTNRVDGCKKPWQC
jgi:hypothetical protein